MRTRIHHVCVCFNFLLSLLIRSMSRIFGVVMQNLVAAKEQHFQHQARKPSHRTINQLRCFLATKCFSVIERGKCSAAVAKRNLLRVTL